MKIVQSMIHWVACWVVLTLCTGCPPSTNGYQFIRQIDSGSYERLDLKGRSTDCLDSDLYIPDTNRLTLSPVRYIRVNAHVVDNDAGTANFDRPTGERYIRALFEAANYYVGRNERMWLPFGNTTPPLPPRYQYVLTGRENDPTDSGIYFHRDSRYFQHDKTSRRFYSAQQREIFDTLGVRSGEVLNIFFVEHPTDSLHSPTYRPSSDGVGYPKWVKIVGQFHRYDERKSRHTLEELVDHQSGILNHEIGHTLGLAHTWASNDGCDDTPKNPNCWNLNERKPPCDTWENISNNMMDYNAYRRALTACQLGKIHQGFHFDQVQRGLLRPDWCIYDSTATVVVRRREHWPRAVDLSGDILIKRRGELSVSCTVNLPKGARIRIESGGKLIVDGGRLRNDCGEQWLGIETAEGSSSGSIVLLNDGLIEHTVHAIQTVPNAEFGQ